MYRLVTTKLWKVRFGGLNGCMYFTSNDMHHALSQAQEWGRQHDHLSPISIDLVGDGEAVIEVQIDVP